MRVVDIAGVSTIYGASKDGGQRGLRYLTLASGASLFGDSTRGPSTPLVKFALLACSVVPNAPVGFPPALFKARSS
jgi:hypothetical protein